MSPNQPKTPVTNFRLDPETKARLARLAADMNSTMTEAVKRATKAAEEMAAAMKPMKDEADTYPFEAYQQGLNAYRVAMQYRDGEWLDERASDAVQAVIAASWPIVCAAKIEQERRRTLVDVVQRLEGYGVDEDVVKHFIALLDPRP